MITLRSTTTTHSTDRDVAESGSLQLGDRLIGHVDCREDAVVVGNEVRDLIEPGAVDVKQGGAVTVTGVVGAGLERALVQPAVGTVQRPQRRLGHGDLMADDAQHDHAQSHAHLRSVKVGPENRVHIGNKIIPLTQRIGE